MSQLCRIEIEDIGAVFILEKPLRIFEYIEISGLFWGLCDLFTYCASWMDGFIFSESQ